MNKTTTDNYKFTQDWFAWAPKVWEQLIPHLPERKRFLEVGSYEGRSTVWMVEHMMEDGGSLVAIDTWEGGEEHATIGEKMNVVEANFDHNMLMCLEKFPNRSISKLKLSSYEALGQQAMRFTTGKQYDFIYIDGSHIARDVLTDACMAWPLLKLGGIMMFDDYTWGNPRDILHRPKLAIDSFINIFAEQIDIVATGYQVGIKKK
jgi:predicted O-methyltransferase YrrM